MNIIFFDFVFLVLTFLGYRLAYLHRSRQHRFNWFGFISIIIWPLLYVIFLTAQNGYGILELFFASAIIGLFLEYSLGLIYDKLENKKLWKYSQWNINGYVSWLCIPVWGIAGVIFWTISQAIGL
ncbi:MAG: hypothetical protein A3J07_04725 [Candidatus Doudnabacteria bacterium RIFCSPLOWO2_02_FULL_49_13]|uniref:Lycopene cyclase domain-containing protein n=1 Tax=Candidatus Doudnabacteria bacterium RIFCSPHIGHO2_12_FULL_48_16 TaxID=1817838 RepID=A0A1F5PK22_9BACT|nr:MAG: hypothetical protein A3B77_01525 [Candidatus Doudnabacteria bacterium RIFCSPHIGHO2_02_FULL_49_24]OGE90209.1 MAG: hypothetical protein A3E29_03865 [Candidatus Doudnabacteria bacterium RIFCSPHIGHO2_12_FULL_48_16]OGF02870.1 MAG: hypothetical protein A3H14_00210 [Candidatus Doudnabacteria bacterium RIFCSPLOWO2_12_FULL_49_8]OGF03351.1 MAG: hypothetical protein A3J07_04725 [Candidatus Doudnabacteria bacterium RIFCSPLOWO2_02_FULL_49_13]